MDIDEFIALLKEHFYITNRDAYVSKSADRHLLRFICKHPLLTPEIIVVNDQPYGFRRLSKRIRNLERFPIFCDIEYLEMNDEIYLEKLDLFAEFSCDLNTTYGEFLQICKTYRKYVVVERLKRLDDDSCSSLIISSTIEDLLFDEELEDDESRIVFSNLNIVDKVALYLKKFTAFIKTTDALINA